MRIEIENIYGYYSTNEELIREMAKKATQIMLIEGYEGKSKTIKVVMVFDD